MRERPEERDMTRGVLGSKSRVRSKPTSFSSRREEGRRRWKKIAYGGRVSGAPDRLINKRKAGKKAVLFQHEYFPVCYHTGP